MTVNASTKLKKTHSWVNTSPGIWKKKFEGSENPVLLDLKITKSTSDVLKKFNDETQSNSSSDDETESPLKDPLRVNKRTLVPTIEEVRKIEEPLTIKNDLKDSSPKKVPGCLERLFSCIFPRKS